MRVPARAVAVVAVSILCLSVPQAEAGGGKVRYSGKSGQGKKVALRTDRAGKLERFSIGFKAVCGRGHLDDGIQRFVPPLRQVDENGFRDGGTYEIPYSRGGTGKIRVRLEGERVSPERFRGTFSFHGAYFTAAGNEITTCRTPLISWSADD